MRKPASDEEIGALNPALISLVEDLAFDEVLVKNTVELTNYFRNLEQSKWDYAYGEGKWTIKEVLSHLIDVERIMANRALYALRGQSKVSLPNMDENGFQENVNLEKRTPESIIAEFEIVRKATEILFSNISDEESKRMVLCNNKPTSARAFAFLIAGHGKHHLNILEERYF